MKEELTRDEIKRWVVSIKEYEEYIKEEATQKDRPVLFNNTNEDDKTYWWNRKNEKRKS